MSCGNNYGRIAVRAQRIYNGATLLTRGAFSSDGIYFYGACYTEPLTFVSARASGDAEITSLNITPANDGGRARIAVTFEYNVTVTFTDACGCTGYAMVRMTDTADLMVTLPSEKYEITVSVEFASVIGSISSSLAQFTACRRLYLKLLVPCDIVLYASCGVTLPEADLTENAVCRELD